MIAGDKYLRKRLYLLDIGHLPIPIYFFEEFGLICA
jgi:hypothetical protein